MEVTLFTIFKTPKNYRGLSGITRSRFGGHYVTGKVSEGSEANFFEIIESELSKINTFFAERLSDASRMWKDLKREISSIVYSIYKGKGFHDPNGMFQAHNLDYSLIKKLKNKKKSLYLSFKSLDVATTEFYIYLNHIQQYKTLNFTGFRKILKKFDKVFKSERGALFMINRVETSNFFVNSDVQGLVLEVEENYIKIFSENKRSDGMNKLRIPSISGLARLDKPSYFFGFFSSACLVVLAAIIITCVYRSFEQLYEPELLIISSQFMLIFFIIGYGINLYFWKRCAVNHVLIFEINPRDNITFVQCLEAGFFLLFLWHICLFCCLCIPNNEKLRKLMPSLTSLFYFGILVFPINIFYHTSRIWALKTTARNLLTPFIPVRFADFWLYDQFCSLSFPLSHAIVTAICYPMYCFH
ncbi:Xenotropic and polytropic retrovirus receptor 1 [Thelohanellus kitauei]|uniref:Xenotropic and polytropic retrovirus receptor 1 n=1 Tax=Thelohanellus kitauei TaxID=669202 RepID=A0A0C2JDK9_THEKT|nr:Xenotropic and polytropic retrovirus receptor 1 [Thelohanellus kitauei]